MFPTEHTSYVKSFHATMRLQFITPIDFVNDLSAQDANSKGDQGAQRERQDGTHPE
jgi:hypothetical protein